MVRVMPETASQAAAMVACVAMGCMGRPAVRANTNTTIELMRRIADSGVTMLVFEHDMHVVFSLAERISVLAQGAVIAEDAPDKIKGDPRVQEAYLGGAHL